MAFWPRDERIRRPITAKRKEPKSLAKEKGRDYPNLEPGLIGAATLLENKDKKLEWDFVTTPTKGAFHNRLKLGKHLNVLPKTQPPPNKNTSRTIQQRAEQGANFLRTYLPDVEIASELIRDQLLEEAQLCEDLEVFDPYAGNLLDIFQPSQTPDLSFLFPTGDTNRDLSISYVSYFEDLSILFKPVVTPLYTFSTPIQQITTSQEPDANLVVRTYSSTQLFTAKLPNTTTAATISHLGTFSRADTNDEVIVDVKCLPSSAGILAMGDGGTIFNCSVENGTKSVTPLYTISSPGQIGSGFWRISLDSNTSIGYLMSENSVQQIDYRTNTAQPFFSVTNEKHVFTSIEDCGSQNMLPLCSTNQIIWMDTRYARKPLLAYSHGRQYDRYLSTHTTYRCADNPLTFLTSRNNGMVTVYDVSRSLEGLIHLNNLPYVLPGNLNMYQKHLGQKFIFHNESMGLVRLSERKGVEYSEVLPSTAEPHGGHTVELTEEMFKWRATHASVPANINPLGLQEFSQVCLVALFCRYFEERKKAEEENAEVIHDLLDYFPRYLQSKDSPADHMLTIHDIAFCAGDEPDHPSRADFLTESMICSKRGFRALKQGRLSARLVRSPWHRSLLPVLRHLDPAFPADPIQSMDYLQKFRVADDEKHSNKSREYEQDACEQLTMDLALGSDIYLDAPIFKAAEVNALEAMTEALFIGDGPPPVQFGYLRPVEKTRSYYEGESKTSDGPDMPLGIRLLLKDWDSGKADDYIYQDPYDAASPAPVRTLNQPVKQRQNQTLPVKFQRPPQVLATNTVAGAPPEIHKKLASKIQSQDRFLPSGTDFRISQPTINFSQELAVSTQIMPGPHGGRPGPKKKPPKKRLGGF
ncbi:hypothetical protein CVT25_015288 [Psilocybe cyanescens]|uniref:Uncharacterized protein n=1 Tax=Psilocybe cyanescens TaxID=93625 RepID=A0A409XRE4_PSICY|nr:hypothetical protein CVT25_015288 [Psilocybe cyanescens]